MKTITSTLVPTTLPTPGNNPCVVDALRATPMAEAIRFGEVVLQIESITAERLATVPVSAIDELIGLLDDIAGRIKTAQSEVAKTLTARYAAPPTSSTASSTSRSRLIKPSSGIRSSWPQSSSALPPTVTSPASTST